MRLRLIEQFQRRAQAAPNAPSLRPVDSTSDGDVVTRGTLAAWTNALAARLAASVPPGGVVLICSENQPEFTAAFLAALSAGLKAFPISPELADPEMISAAERSNANAIVGSRASLETLVDRIATRISIDAIADLPPSNSIDRGHETGGLLLLSSGTTGRPKIVFRDARSLDAVGEAVAESIGFRESDHVLGCVPLCHSYGIEHGLLAPLWAGAAVHLIPGFDLTLSLKQIASGGITVVPGVPFMFEMLARHARDDAQFPALRRSYSAGGPLPRAIAKEFQKRFGVRVSQLYGATEIGSVTYADPDAPGYDAASVGRAMSGVAIRILSPDALDDVGTIGDEGHVAVKSASMLSGYLDETEPPALHDGFFLTGDLGRLDATGNLTVTGRIKLLIDVGGLKVNPLEVEDVLLEHPGVASCVVVPVRVSETVCRMKAIVTASPGAAPPAAESLRKFARDRLAGYKVPRLFEVRDTLPKSPTGKILRHLVEA
jgi:acyl-CoA synthetase (AMP-forming)/AMP-acid ligase II